MNLGAAHLEYSRDTRRSRIAADYWQLEREDGAVFKPIGTVVLVTASVVAVVSWPADAQPVAPTATYSSGTGRNDLITYCLPGEAGKPTALTIVDPIARRIAVYHVSRDSGEIQLKSVRNIAWDLGMEYFNGGNPLPEEIRKGLERTQQ